MFEGKWPSLMTAEELVRLLTFFCSLCSMESLMFEGKWPSLMTSEEPVRLLTFFWFFVFYGITNV